MNFIQQYLKFSNSNSWLAKSFTQKSWAFSYFEEEKKNPIINTNMAEKALMGFRLQKFGGLQKSLLFESDITHFWSVLLFICLFYYIRRYEYENPTSTQVWSKAHKTLTQKSNLEDQQDRRGLEEKEKVLAVVAKIIPKWKKLHKLGLKPQEAPRPRLRPLIPPLALLQKRVTVKCPWNNWPLMYCPRRQQVLTLTRTNTTTYSWLWTYSY